MVTIKMTTSSPRAVAWARRLLESKRELQEEIKEDAKSPAFLEIVEDLIQKNESRKNTRK